MSDQCLQLADTTTRIVLATGLLTWGVIVIRVVSIIARCFWTGAKIHYAKWMDTP